ncbi:hypothetical protein, partial [Nonomuraea diastatica]|uniref:hypothetical protein n=1 Tax=Nonomuraea diastatica TaxID=1848329 RepID=UPI001C7057BA
MPTATRAGGRAGEAMDTQADRRVHRCTDEQADAPADGRTSGSSTPACSGTMPPLEPGRRPADRAMPVARPACRLLTRPPLEVAAVEVLTGGGRTAVSAARSRVEQARWMRVGGGKVARVLVAGRRPGGVAA